MISYLLQLRTPAVPCPALVLKILITPLCLFKEKVTLGKGHHGLKKMEPWKSNLIWEVSPTSWRNVYSVARGQFSGNVPDLKELYAVLVQFWPANQMISHSTLWVQSVTTLVHPYLLSLLRSHPKVWWQRWQRLKATYTCMCIKSLVKVNRLL